MNRLIRINRMQNVKDRFRQIWKDLNVLITECENDGMEDKVLEEVITARAIASGGEKISGACISMDNKAIEMESGD